MDIVLARGLKCSYLLIPRTSTFSINLSSFFCKYSKLTAYQQIQCFEKHRSSSHELNNSTLSNRCGKVYQLNHVPCKVNIFQYSTSSKSDSSEKSELPNKDCYKPPLEQKPSIFQRMKQMTKDYWHILIPVHIVTSIGWGSIFYVAAKNGVDIVGMLESLNMSERYLEMLKGSNAGHWAVAYALYKIFTPLRYTVTVGGTTMCIRYLNKWGYLKFPKSKKLEQSIKCAEEHKSTYGKSSIPDKNSQQQFKKT